MNRYGTVEAELRYKSAPGRYKYRVSVFKEDYKLTPEEVSEVDPKIKDKDGRIFIDDCPGLGNDGDKC